MLLKAHLLTQFCMHSQFSILRCDLAMTFLYILISNILHQMSKSCACSTNVYFKRALVIYMYANVLYGFRLGYFLVSHVKRLTDLCPFRMPFRITIFVYGSTAAASRVYCTTVRKPNSIPFIKLKHSNNTFQYLNRH